MIDFMKKNKKDILCILLLVIVTLLVILFVTLGKYFGNSNDWLNQHIMFPDYFRKLFYETGNLFPQFASNIGGGQNIYNFSYYGFLSPIILFSYLLPLVNMIDYIIISSIILLIASGILMYYFLKANFKNRVIAFTGAFMLIFSSPMLQHFHKQLMFVNYMPFLILGLIGIDQYFKKDKTALFMISCFLMIMTSYYYSIGGLIVLSFYAIYKIFSLEKVNVKIFLNHAVRLLIPVLIAICSSAILVLPTLSAILSSRGSSLSNQISLLDLIIPDLSLNSLLYDPYNIGALGISVMAILSIFLIKKKNYRILNVLLLLTFLFPFWQYFLNGFLYVRPKVLIPFLPLFIFSSCLFLENILKYKINLKHLTFLSVLAVFVSYFYDVNKFFYIDIIILLLLIYSYYKSQSSKTLIFGILLISLIVGVSSNVRDGFITSDNREEVISSKLSEDISSILEKDNDYYRFGNYLNATLNFNHIYDANYKTTSVYSSVYNDYYKIFNDDIMNNNRPSRNILNLATTPNIFMSLFMNHKYIISKQSMLGYKKLEEYDNIYVSYDTLPTFYVSNNLISKKSFDTLKYPYNIEVLLNNTIVDSSKNNVNLKESKINEVNILNYFNFSDINYTLEDGKYILEFDTNKKMTIKSKKKLNNKVVIISFDVLNKQKCSIGDQSIIINGTSNKKTCSSWLYYNQNENFSYVFSKENLSKLEVVFSKGRYEIADVHMYILDYKEIKDINKKVQKVDIDTSKSISDTIVGKVEVVSDGSYFVSSIPYDDNFIVKVDNKKVDIEIVNTSFLGFKIPRGKHEVQITYKSPLRKEGVILSIVGLMFAVLLIFIENKKKFHD